MTQVGAAERRADKEFLTLIGSADRTGRILRQQLETLAGGSFKELTDGDPAQCVADFIQDTIARRRTLTFFERHKSEMDGWKPRAYVTMMLKNWLIDRARARKAEAKAKAEVANNDGAVSSQTRRSTRTSAQSVLLQVMDRISAIREAFSGSGDSYAVLLLDEVIRAVGSIAREARFYQMDVHQLCGALMERVDWSDAEQQMPLLPAGDPDTSLPPSINQLRPAWTTIHLLLLKDPAISRWTCRRIATELSLSWDNYRQVRSRQRRVVRHSISSTRNATLFSDWRIGS
jgi:hypothetical protein